jgi:DNA-binding NarL/FixJ family response regulator
MCIADRQTREKPTVQEKRRKRYQMRVTRREAVQHVNISEVDLMITDLIMPEQEGLETIEILHRRRPDLKIIAISGKFGGQFLRVAKLFGAQATLTKPVLPDKLLEAVRHVLGSSL